MLISTFFPESGEFTHSFSTSLEPQVSLLCSLNCWAFWRIISHLKVEALVDRI